MKLALAGRLPWWQLSLAGHGVLAVALHCVMVWEWQHLPPHRFLVSIVERDGDVEGLEDSESQGEALAELPFTHDPIIDDPLQNAPAPDAEFQETTAGASAGRTAYTDVTSDETHSHAWIRIVEIDPCPRCDTVLPHWRYCVGCGTTHVPHHDCRQR